MTETETRNSLMEAVEKRAVAARVGLSSLCRQAGISYTVAYRWRARTYLPTLPTIGKLEETMAGIEKARAA